MTVFDILAKRNADKLRAVRADGASIRYHLRMDGSEAGVLDVFELFNGVPWRSTASPKIPRHGTTLSRSSSRLTGACAVGFNLTMASASETASLPCMTSGLESAP